MGEDKAVWVAKAATTRAGPGIVLTECLSSMHGVLHLVPSITYTGHGGAYLPCSIGSSRQKYQSLPIILCYLRPVVTQP